MRIDSLSILLSLALSIALMDAVPALAISPVFFGQNQGLAKITWTGRGQNSNWSNPANWYRGKVPGTNDIAIFDNTCVRCDATIDANTSIKGLSMAASYAGTITQAAGKTLTVGTSNWTQAGGTFAGGDSAITISGHFNLNAGTFTSTSGSLNLTKNTGASTTFFTYAGGTFNHNNGTVNFNMYEGANAGNPTYTISITGTLTLYNVIYNFTDNFNTPAFMSISGGALVVLGSFRHTRGILIGNIELRGNLIVDSTASGNSCWDTCTGVDAVNGSFTLTGSADQTYSYAAGGQTASIVVNKSGGTVGPAAGTTDFSVSKFTLLAGTFQAPSGTFTVGWYIGGGYNLTVPIFSYQGGTYSDDGTLVFSPNDSSNCCTPTYVIDLTAGPLTIGKLKLNVRDPYFGTYGTIQIANNALEVTGLLTYLQGSVSGTLNLSGNLVIDSAAKGGSGSIVLNGTGDQTYTDTGGTGIGLPITINKASGSVTPAAGTTDVYLAGLTLTQGSFTAPSGTLYLRCSSTMLSVAATGATLVPNNGTLAFYNSGGTATCNIALNSQTLNANHVVFKYTGNTSGAISTFSLGAADTIAASGNYSQIRTQSNGTVAVSGGTIQIAGNLIGDGSTNGGSATLVLNGAGDQTYTAVASGTFPLTQINKASGSVAADAGTTDITFKAFSLLAGGFSAPTGTMMVGVGAAAGATIFNVAASGTTFTPNAGTLVFSGNGAGSNYNLALNGGTLNLNHLIFAFGPGGNAGTGATFSIGSGDTFVVAGNYTQQTYRTTSTSTVNGGTIQVAGNLIQDSACAGGSTVLLLNGAGDQTYTGVSGGYYPNLKINKASGNVLAAAGTTDVVFRSLDLTAGTFVAPTGNLTVAYGAPTQTVFKLAASGASFDPNGGTLIFTGTGASSTLSVNLNGSSLAVNNVVFQYGGTFSQVVSTFAFGVTDTLSVAGNFTQQRTGTVSTATLNGGTVTVAGNVSLNAGAGAGTTILEINGAGDQIYGSTGGTLPFLKINKSGGTFSAASGTTDLACNGLIMTAGTFVAPTGNLTLSGSSVTVLNVSGGTFNPNGGTIVLASSNIASMTNTINLNGGSFTVNHASFQYAGNSSIANQYTLGAGDILIVSGNYVQQRTQTNGTVQVNTGTVQVAGNVTIGAGSAGGSAKITLNGTGTQSISSSGTNPTGLWKVDKPSGTATLATNLALSSAGQGLTISSGTLDLSGKTLTVNGAETIALTGASLVKSGGTNTYGSCPNSNCP